MATNSDVGFARQLPQGGFKAIFSPEVLMKVSRPVAEVVACLLVAVCGCAPVADMATPSEDKQREDFAVRLVDEQGKPVAGAELGLSAAWSDNTYRESGWEFGIEPMKSDSDGMAFFESSRESLDSLSLVARHADRNLVANENLDPLLGNDGFTVTMHPACRVTGHVTCKQLSEQGKPLVGIVAAVNLGDRLAAEYWSKEPDFHFLLPPGKYHLQLRSDIAQTHVIGREFEVPADTSELALDPLDLPLSELALLAGQPAPELRDVVAWKNSEPLRLADLRGKVVLLDFWGWWCGACVSNMPELFALHDKYHDQGLVIVGVHIDADAGEEPVDSVETLDRQLTTIRQDIWNGRDVPYPVALALNHPQPFHIETERPARTAVAADYGVWFYPTWILIDRQGRVVGPLDQRDYIKTIEAALAEK
jgi:thiol-disulfide isomerase/thioredoxin